MYSHTRNTIRSKLGPTLYVIVYDNRFVFLLFIVLGLFLFASAVNSFCNCVQCIEKRVMEFEWDQHSASRLE